MKILKAGLPVLFVVGAVVAAAPAEAQNSDFSLEAQVGYYDPDAVDENGEVLGGAFGWQPSDNFAMLLSAGVLDIEDDFLDIEDADLRYDLFLVDLSFQWFPTGRSFYVFAGPGLATLDLEIDRPGDDNDLTDSQNIFTVNGGLGFRWDAGEHFFVRPELKARWFDGDDFDAGEVDSWDSLDVQYTVGLGWHF